MRIAVLGAGSIGCLIAAKLVEAGHDVLVHARGEHGAVLALSGLNVSGIWDFQIQPNQWTVSLDEAGIHPSLEKSFDQSIITCKAKDTAKLAEIAAQITDGPVLSLQNGLGNHEILSRYVFENSAVGVTTNAVKRISPGQIEWVGLLENHPKEFAYAKSLEKTAEENQSPFTWVQGKSLSELEKPESIKKIKEHHAKTLERLKKKNQAKLDENPFLKGENIEISDNLAQDDVSSSCLICHK